MKWIAYLFLFLLPSTTLAGNVPHVLVSIKPIHSLVSNLLNGITKPELLLSGTQTPHDHQFKPGEVARLASADVIIWIGPSMEGFLSRYLRKMKDRHVITLIHEPGEHGANELHADPHRWLDPELAFADSRKIAFRIIELYPHLRTRILENLEQLSRRLQKLDGQLKKLFAGNRHISAMLYHDAWSYFTARYQLTIDGIVNPQPHVQPGIRHLNQVQKTILSRQTRCLLIEPQFKPSYLKSIAASNQQIKVLKVDPLGANAPANRSTYFNLMLANANVFAKCR